MKRLGGNTVRVTPALADRHPAEVDLVAQLRAICGDAVLRQLGIYELPSGFKLSVAMPVFNERHTIREIVARAPQFEPAMLVFTDPGEQMLNNGDIVRAAELPHSLSEA